jgi:hypothetical protein
MPEYSLKRTIIGQLAFGDDLLDSLTKFVRKKKYPAAGSAGLEPPLML